MAPRLNLQGNEIAMRFAKHLIGAHQVLAGSTLPPSTQELVNIRASQINGCSFCTDMHTKEALQAGESQARLNLVAAWRETSVFTDAERAALELTEQGTRIGGWTAGVSDEAWENAAKYYDEEQLGALVCAVALINAMNRANVILRQPAIDYQPDQMKSLVAEIERR